MPILSFEVKILILLLKKNMTIRKLWKTFKSRGSFILLLEFNSKEKKKVFEAQLLKLI